MSSAINAKRHKNRLTETLMRCIFQPTKYQQHVFGTMLVKFDFQYSAQFFGYIVFRRHVVGTKSHKINDGRGYS